MKEAILCNLDDPRQLEKLYRSNKATFKRAFNLLYPDIRDNPAARIWNERLNFEGEEVSWGTKRELLYVFAATLIALLLAKLPELAKIEDTYFYARNTAFIILPLLTAYFAWKQKNNRKNIAICSAVILLSALYINLLTGSDENDTFVLACIHMPLFLWAVLGLSFVGNNLKNHQRRLEFLRFNGDLAVMTTIILIAGMILTAITITLFSLINAHIEEFYLRYVVVWGLVAAPIIGTYLVQANPQLVNKVSPVIARIFTPLLLLTLVIYLAAVIGFGKSPYTDRDFLITFNILLIGVMAIIFFSVSETPEDAKNNTGTILLLALSIVTVIVNMIALSAILFRITEWGISPNRLAVLGSNLLILTNLFMVTYRLFQTVRQRNQIENVKSSIAVFLPIYALWTMLVTFIFPLLFNFK